MSQAEVNTKSRIINKKLINQVEWSKLKRISVFKPIIKLNEVDISPLAEKLEQQAISVEFMSPSKAALMSKNRFDLIIVPCLAFDKDNFRLGWGGGFYDRFLAEQLHALKIGVCFQNGFIPAGVPREAHDISLDVIISDD